MKPLRKRPPCCASGIDLTRQAEQRLYPGRLSRQLTWAQQRRAVNVAKAELVAAGRWPEAKQAERIRGRFRYRSPRGAA